MHDKVLQELDLNLLVVLDVLLASDSMSVASATLGVSEAALRHPLRRLREVFDDPLLLVEQDVLIKTAKAQVLVEPLDQALAELRHVLGTCATFQPGRSRHQFRLACDDYSALLILPGLMQLVSEQAPGLNFEVIPYTSGGMSIALDEGRVDLVLQHACSPRSHLLQRPLLVDPLCCAVRTGHPALKGGLDSAAYVSLPHLEVASVLDLIERSTESSLPAERHVALKLAHLGAAPDVLSCSDMVLTAPRRCLEHWSACFPLAIYPAPLALPDYALTMAWQSRNEYHPAHRWLRNAVTDVSRALARGARSPVPAAL